MKLKNYILSFVFALSAFMSFAQQDAHYTNFMFNNLVLNPAVAGSEKVLTSSFFYRHQWVNFNGNPVVPVTQTFSSHMQIPNQNIGAGLYLVNERIGFERRLDINIAGSYFIDFRDVSFLEELKRSCLWECNLVSDNSVLM